MSTPKYKHLSFEDRCVIHEFLDRGFNFTHIAHRLGKDRTTISYEVRKHRFLRGNTKPNRPCCFESKPPYVCNACPKLLYCRKQKYSYDHSVAHNEYKQTLIIQRSHLYITNEQIASINDVILTDHLFKTNIVISKSDGVSNPWIIVTNGSTKRAIKDYGYRFGSIESLFKNQKSNGFYIESVIKADLDYFTSMYTLVCFSTLFLTILGADYSKNKCCYKNIKITTHKYFIKNGTRVKKRVMSLFNTGLTLFHLAFQSSRYIRIPFSFTLYDI